MLSSSIHINHTLDEFRLKMGMIICTMVHPCKKIHLLFTNHHTSSSKKIEA